MKNYKLLITLLFTAILIGKGTCQEKAFKYLIDREQRKAVVFEQTGFEVLIQIDLLNQALFTKEYHFQGGNITDREKNVIGQYTYKTMIYDGQVFTFKKKLFKKPVVFEKSVGQISEVRHEDHTVHLNGLEGSGEVNKIVSYWTLLKALGRISESDSDTDLSTGIVLGMLLSN